MSYFNKFYKENQNETSGNYYLTVLSIGVQINLKGQHYSTSEELLSDMRFFRNSIFAHHGRKFISPDLQAHFGSKTWYKPKDSFDVSQLSSKELLAIGTLKKIEDYYEQLNSQEQKTAEGIFRFIKSYTFQRLDTVLYTIADFDTQAGLDTIQTIIKETELGNFTLNYRFEKNNKTMWQDSVVNPYFWIGDHEIFKNWENHFYIGFTATQFCKAQSNAMWEQPFELGLLELGYSSILDCDQHATISEYESYLKNFRGNLLNYNAYEGGGKLLVWYEPIKRFITFYAP